jgi:MinD superfamily P-loop ATPase
MSSFRQIAVISGKGGTGKTTVAACLASLAAGRGEKLVLVDADVDAPNLHVLFRGSSVKRVPVSGPPLASIKAVKPKVGSRWEEVCSFGAIEGVEVDALRCVGCRACEIVAPPGGVQMEEREAGEIILDEVGIGAFLRARMFPGEPGFGGVVYRLRAMAEGIAMEKGFTRIIIDGSPGIGCTVLASISGCDLALVVAEPSLSGWHDFMRVYDLCGGLGVPVAVCVNKHDINPTMSDRIEQFCTGRGLLFAGRLPFDEHVVRALQEGMILVDAYPDSVASRGVAEIAAKVA